MDNDQRVAFNDLKRMIKALDDRFSKVTSGETPCQPAVDVARLNGKIKTLRLLWLPIILAILLFALNLVVASMK